jgi:hypothetical protein
MLLLFVDLHLLLQILLQVLNRRYALLDDVASTSSGQLV